MWKAVSLVNNHMEWQPLWSVDVCPLIDQLVGFPQQYQTDLDSFILPPDATGSHCASEYSIGKFVHTILFEGSPKRSSGTRRISISTRLIATSQKQL